MKKLITLVACLAFLLVAMPVMAGKPDKPGKAPDKVEVCHVLEENDVVPFGPRFIHFGIAINVSSNALAGHERHFDASEEGYDTGEVNIFGKPIMVRGFFGDIAAGPIGAFRNFGFNILSNTNCYTNPLN